MPIKKADVKIGGIYWAKVSDKLTKVRVLRAEGKGYQIVNLATNREVYFRSAARLRREVVDTPIRCGECDNCRTMQAARAIAQRKLHDAIGFSPALMPALKNIIRDQWRARVADLPCMAPPTEVK